jgi:hypothetical protein
LKTFWTGVGGWADSDLTTEPGQGRGVMMPRRKRTRAREQNDRISAERAINEARLADEHRRHQAWLAAIYEPPPF